MITEQGRSEGVLVDVQNPLIAVSPLLSVQEAFTSPPKQEKMMDKDSALFEIPYEVQLDVLMSTVRWEAYKYSYPDAEGTDQGGKTSRYFVEYNKRPVFVTPFPGAYGTAGYVVTINGSPPRGVFIWQARSDTCGPTIRVLLSLCERTRNIKADAKKYQPLRHALLALVAFIENDPKS